MPGDGGDSGGGNDNNGDSSFSHAGKTVDVSAEDLLPDAESFPSNVWSFNSSEISDAGSNVLSAFSGSYIYGVASTVMADIYVYDTVENAVNKYSDSKDGFELSFLYVPSYGKFEQSFKVTPMVTYVYFQDMNVYGVVIAGSSLFQSQLDKIMLDIENKIHNAAH